MKLFQVSYRQDPRLKRAVQSADIEGVRKMIANGADVNYISRRRLPEHKDGAFCAFDSPQMVAPLIDPIILLRPKSPHPSNVMMDIFNLLLKSGADVNLPCPDNGRTPLMYAADIGNVKCVEKLIKKGANVFTKDKQGDTACTIAARNGSVSVLKCLIEHNKVDKNSTDKDGRSVLYWAVRSHNIEAVRYLLKLGVTMTKSITQECMEPCYYCRTNLPYFRTVELKFNPCIEALASGLLDMVKLMEEYECELLENIYALGFAVHGNQVEVVDYLLSNYKYPLNYEYVGPMNYIDVGTEQIWNPHNTLLTSACHHESGEMVKLLLEHGADPNIKYGKCVSAINVAIQHRHVEVIARFIRGGVNVNAKSFYLGVGAVRPFEAAVWHHHSYAVQMLLVYGCSFGVFSLPKEHQCKVDIASDLQELLEEWNVYKNNVLPLKQKCRMVILNHLSPQADGKIKELPLPPLLFKYLNIPELDDIIEASKNNSKIYYC